jgi:hypothetical protein
MTIRNLDQLRGSFVHLLRRDAPQRGKNFGRLAQSFAWMAPSARERGPLNASARPSAYRLDQRAARTARLPRTISLSMGLLSKARTAFRQFGRLPRSG